MEEGPWGQGRCRGRGGSGPQIRGQSRLRTRASPHFPALPGISHMWAGDKARGRRASLGFIQVAFRLCPMRGGAHGVQSSAHRALGAPRWPGVTSPLCQHRGVDSFPPGFMERDLTGPGLHPRPTTHIHWPTVLGSPQGSTGLPVPASAPQTLVLPSREREGECGLASTFTSLCPERPLRWASGPAWHSGLQWAPSNTGWAPTDLREARRDRPFPAPSSDGHPASDWGPRGEGGEPPWGQPAHPAC